MRVATTAATEKEIRQAKVPNVNHEKPAVVRRLQSDEVDHSSNLSSLTSQLTLNISKQIQQKLQQEMKQQCEIIKEKFLIEKVPVQIDYRDFVVREIWFLFFYAVLSGEDEICENDERKSLKIVEFRVKSCDCSWENFHEKGTIFG